LAINDHRRVSGACRNHPFSRFHGSLHNRRASSHAQQGNSWVMEDLIGGFDGGYVKWREM
jgi:hypothetical protein